MRLVTAVVFLASSAALAHIKLHEPAPMYQQGFLGDPQKAAPCGPATAAQGTATNAVTTVEAGSQLTVSWDETVLHPGHFRLSIAADRASFVTPTPVLTNGGSNCSTAPIESTPVAPTIIDGLFAHTSASPGGTWSTQITVPDMECDNCTLQLMQFMSSHGPPCFYYQCATLKIVRPVVDAGAPPADAGAGGGGGGSGGTGGTAGGGGMPTSMGCSSVPGGLAALLLGAATLLLRARRR